MRSVKLCLVLFTNLHMPLLAHGIDNTPLNRSPAGTTDRYTHLVMAGQAVELSLQFSGFSRQFLPVNKENIETQRRGSWVSNPLYQIKWI